MTRPLLELKAWRKRTLGPGEKTEVALDLKGSDLRFPGPGLSPDIRDRAFERFARGASTASVPGHGLGLAVVKAIAVRHGIGISLKDAKPGLAVVFTCPALTSG